MTQEFLIVRGRPDTVEQSVNDLFRHGWELHGPMQKMVLDGYDILVQAMVSENKASTFDHVQDLSDLGIR